MSPDRLWGHPLLSKWESNSLEWVAMHCSWNWFMLHTWRSFLSSYLGNHPRGILTESLKEVGWNLWQQFVYGFRLTVFSLSLPHWCFICAIRQSGTESWWYQRKWAMANFSITFWGSNSLKGDRENLHSDHILNKNTVHYFWTHRWWKYTSILETEKHYRKGKHLMYSAPSEGIPVM